jgi:hypothetical protein
MRQSGTTNSSLALRLKARGCRLAQVMGVGWLAATEETRLLGNVAKVRLAAITAGAGTASVLWSTGTGSSAPASPGPALVAAANLIRIN